MAKVTGPLLSMDARGKIADSIVFMGWKGIQTVRKFVIPANPNTQAQQDVRAYMTNAVGRYRDASMLGPDKVAWDAYAATEAKPMSGFNSYCKTDINIQKAELAPLLLVGFELDVATPSQIDVTVNSTVGKDITVYWGVKPSRLDDSDDMVDTAGVYTYTIPTLTPGVKYYVSCIMTTAANLGSRTGILNAIVTAA